MKKTDNLRPDSNFGIPVPAMRLLESDRINRNKRL